MDQTIRNLRAHPTVLQSPSGIRTRYAATPEFARVEKEEARYVPPCRTGVLNAIPVYSTRMVVQQTRVVNLPEPREGVAYLVEMDVLLHPSVAGRTDVFYPAVTLDEGEIRDYDGILVSRSLVAAPAKD